MQEDQVRKAVMLLLHSGGEERQVYFQFSVDSHPMRLEPSLLVWVGLKLNFAYHGHGLSSGSIIGVVCPGMSFYYHNITGKVVSTIYPHEWRLVKTHELMGIMGLEV